MQSCELVMFVSSLACCIAKDRTDEEIALLSCIFSQLGDTLGTISAQEAFCSSRSDEDPCCCKDET
ncbi:DUF6774 domain-containing protein [Lacrimispora sp. JR3]|uniref:DUF6774 domain-containing protein n=1 Tax=Lacrimispora sinapis TaxID=3111456 RepID=UPI003748289D